MTEVIKFTGNVLLSFLGFIGLFFTTKEIVIELNFYFYILLILFSFFTSYGIYKSSENIKFFIKRGRHKKLLIRIKSLIFYNEV